MCFGCLSTTASVVHRLGGDKCQFRKFEVSIPYEKKQIAGYVTLPNSSPEFGVILTHGAGGDANSANLDMLAKHLATEGFLVLRFTCKGLNIAYRVKVYTKFEVSIPYEKKQIAGYVTLPNSSPEFGVILTHGAGGDANSANLDMLAKHLATEGFLVLRFTCKGLNIAYRVKVYTKVLEWLRTSYSLKGCFLAGRSMGSRAAVMTTNQADPDLQQSYIRGVVCLAYPLQKSLGVRNLDREQPLLDLKIPALLISGTEDEMMSRSTIDNILTKNDQLVISWVKDAGHSLLRKKVDPESVELVNSMFSDWCKKMSHSKPGSKGGGGFSEKAHANEHDSGKKRKVESGSRRSTAKRKR